MEENPSAAAENVLKMDMSNVRNSPGCAHYFYSALGSILIGIALPTLLVGMRMSRIGLFEDRPEELGVNMVRLFFVGVIVCGPGALLLSSVLLKVLTQPSVLRTQRRTMWTGALGGIAIAFLNVPGYFVAIPLKNDTYVELRVALLFVVAGCTCGLWIAWQAWKASHPGERFLPRFTLRTLILLVILWGAVLVVFQPA